MGVFEETRIVCLFFRPDIAAINSWRGVLDISLFWQVLLAGSVVRSLFSMSALLYKVYQTEVSHFSFC